MKVNNFITLFLWFVIGGLSACVWGFLAALIFKFSFWFLLIFFGLGGIVGIFTGAMCITSARCEKGTINE